MAESCRCGIHILIPANMWWMALYCIHILLHSSDIQDIDIFCEVSFHIFLNCIVIHMLHQLKPKNHPSRGGSFVINKNYPRWWEPVRRLPGRRADRKAISGNYQLNTLTGNESIRSVESNSILETQRCSYDCLIVASSNICLLYTSPSPRDS